MTEVLAMPEVLNAEQVARLIRRERRLQEISLRELAEVFEVSHQTISMAEKPERGGDKINELRARILTHLLKKPVSGPVFIVGDSSQIPLNI